jgi:hypothetical protein
MQISITRGNLNVTVFLVLLLLTISFELDLNLDVMVDVEALGGHDTEEIECKMLMNFNQCKRKKYHICATSWSKCLFFF